MHNFSDGLAAVVDENQKYGFIDKTGKIVIPFKYEMVFDFVKGKAKVTNNDEEFFINKLGKRL